MSTPRDDDLTAALGEVEAASRLVQDRLGGASPSTSPRRDSKRPASLVEALDADRAAAIERARAAEGRVLTLLEERESLRCRLASSEAHAVAAGMELQRARDAAAAALSERDRLRDVIEAARDAEAHAGAQRTDTDEALRDAVARAEAAEAQRATLEAELSNARRALDASKATAKDESLVAQLLPLLPPADPALVDRARLDAADERAAATADELASATAELAALRAECDTMRDAVARSEDLRKGAVRQAEDMCRRYCVAVNVCRAVARGEPVQTCEGEAQTGSDDAGASGAADGEDLEHQLRAERRARRVAEAALDAALHDLEAMRAGAAQNDSASIAPSEQSPTRRRSFAPSAPERDPVVLRDFREAHAEWQSTAEAARAAVDEAKAAHEETKRALRGALQRAAESEQSLATSGAQLARARADREAHQRTIAKQRAEIDALTTEAGHLRGVAQRLKTTTASAEALAEWAVGKASASSERWIEAAHAAAMWRSTCSRVLQALSEHFPDCEKHRLRASLDPAESEAGAVDAAVAFADLLAGAAASVVDARDRARAELATAKDEVERWHGLFPAPNADDADGPFARATALLDERALHSEAIDQERQLRRTLKAALDSARHELSGLKEHLAVIAPEQGEFFARQRGLILRHLVKSVRTLREPKALLEHIAGSADPAIASRAAKSAADVATLRRAADWLLMKTFTTHERAQIDSLDMSLIPDDLSSVGRSPSARSNVTRFSVLESPGGDG